MELRMLFHAFMNNCLLFYSLKSSLWPHLRDFLELISLKAIDISVFFICLLFFNFNLAILKQENRTRYLWCGCIFSQLGLNK